MHRFFADEDSRIRGDEYKHLTRVLRLSEGDEIAYTPASTRRMFGFGPMSGAGFGGERP